MHNINQVLEYLNKLEREGLYSSSCKYCIEVFLPQLEKGKELWEVFAPRHKAQDRCRSGKHNHCTCDTCF